MEEKSPEQRKLIIPKSLSTVVGPQAPKEKRMMAAKGLLPSVDPLTLINCIHLLTQDQDEDVRSEAKKTLAEMPRPLKKSIVAHPDVSPLILHYFVKTAISDDELLEVILVHPGLEVSTFALIAERCSEHIGNMVTNNQEMFLHHPNLLINIKKNPNILKSSIERVQTFLKISGFVVAGEQSELTKEEVEILLSQKNLYFDPILVEDYTDETVTKLKEEEYKELKKNILGQISSLGVSQKVQLALRGNSFSRGILITDPNFIVATAVLSNPSLTSSEVMRYTKMKNINERVIKLIADNREWMRSYAVKLNLVGNSKTPAYLALKLVNFLRMNDLRTLGRDRNIPAQVAKMASQLYKSRM